MDNKDGLVVITDGHKNGYIEPVAREALKKIYHGQNTKKNRDIALNTRSEKLTKEENDTAHKIMEHLLFPEIHMEKTAYGTLTITSRPDI